jgi:alkylation response protein AidB-like acyl-CoA dehydrogenase
MTMTELTEQTVRAEVRAWLAEHWDPNRPLIEWRNMLADAGWGVPHWPREWLGRDLPVGLVPAINDEFAAAKAVSVAAGGPGMLAAVTLLEHGSDTLKARHLRRILTGEDTWCQLFSEPGSGSDLAGATTRADLDGDDWVVNGQKVWTTSAHHARYGILLARTDWDVPKHQGLSFFILDMDQPGVQVHQLKQMNGHASFNEVFMTDARVQRDQLVSSIGNGWAVAVTTLAHERRLADALRQSAAGTHHEGRIYDELRAEIAVVQAPYTWYPQRAGRVDLIIERAKETGLNTDPHVRQEIAKLLIMSKSAEWTARRARAAQQQGKPQGPEGSLGKLAASNVAKAASAVHTLITGTNAMLTGENSPREGIIAEILVSVPAVSIAGGTDEIQRNIISERVLGMGKEPRADTGPFRDVPRNVVT